MKTAINNFIDRNALAIAASITISTFLLISAILFDLMTAIGNH